MHDETGYLLGILTIILGIGFLLIVFVGNMERIMKRLCHYFQRIVQRIKHGYYSQAFYSPEIQARISNLQKKLDQRATILREMITRVYGIPLNTVMVPYFGINIPIIVINRSEIPADKLANSEVKDFLLNGGTSILVFLLNDLRRYGEEWTAEQLNELFKKIQLIVVPVNDTKYPSINYELFTLCPRLIKNRLGGYEHVYKLVTGEYEYLTDSTLPNNIKYDLIGHCLLNNTKDNKLSYIDLFTNMNESNKDEVSI